MWSKYWNTSVWLYLYKQLHAELNCYSHLGATYITEWTPAYCATSTPCYEGDHIVLNCGHGYAWGGLTFENRSATCADYLGSMNVASWIISGPNLCERMFFSYSSCAPSIGALWILDLGRLNGYLCKQKI